MCLSMLIFSIVVCFKTNQSNEIFMNNKKKTKSIQRKRSISSAGRMATEDTIYKTPIADIPLERCKTNEPNFAGANHSVIPDPNLT